MPETTAIVSGRRWADQVRPESLARRPTVTVLLILGGLIALLVGAELLVRGGSAWPDGSGFLRW